VLEDLVAAGAKFARLGDVLDRTRAEAVIDALADLHASYWGDPRLDDGWPWLRPLLDRFEARAGQAVAPTLVRRGLRLARGAVPDELRRPMRGYARRRSAVISALDRAPRTLLHNDCHPGNLAFGAGGRVWLVDWQLVRAGPWARDVAYFCATALDVADRAAWERDLLARYLGRLDHQGVEAPPFDEAWLDYRRHLVYPFEAMVVTLALGVMQPELRVRPVVARTAAAVAAHDAFTLL
jgi:aminoglycoside phosphotransferase (APT) family kinase protein